MRNQTESGIDPLEFCEFCFQKTMPNLCETCKNAFTKISSIHFSQQAKLTRLLNRLEVTPRVVQNRWTCIMPASARKEFLDSLWGIGVSVHTLEDHVKVLTRLYKPEVRRLGEPSQVRVPEVGSWEEFVPKTRSWIPVNIKTNGGELLAKVNLGNILRRTGDEETVYYRLNKNDDSVDLVTIEKRAAYNIMSIISEPTDVYWKQDSSACIGLIDLKDIQGIPEEISSFLNRVGRQDKKIPGILIFESDDIELVRTALSCIKINLVRSSESVTVTPNDKSGMSVLINHLVKERLQVVLDIVQAMGGMAEIEESHIIISGKRGSVRILFVDEDKSTQDGNVFKISISALEDPTRLAEILLTIRKKLALMDVSLESMISQYWPIITTSDLEYVVQSAVSWYGSNPTLAAKIISEHGKLAKIKEWHTKVKEGKTRSSLDTITLGKIIKRVELN